MMKRVPKNDDGNAGMKCQCKLVVIENCNSNDETPAKIVKTYELKSY